MILKDLLDTVNTSTHIVVRTDMSSTMFEGKEICSTYTDLLNFSSAEVRSVSPLTCDSILVVLKTSLSK